MLDDREVDGVSVDQNIYESALEFRRLPVFAVGSQIANCFWFTDRFDFTPPDKLAFSAVTPKGTRFILRLFHPLVR